MTDLSRNIPRVFLSFTSDDLDFVNKLFSRLKQLGVDVWDYSDKDEAIPLGENIKHVLTEQIKESDFFLAIVSNNSIAPEKVYPPFEVMIAVELHKMCFPVIISSRKPAVWSGPYELLSDRINIEMDHDNETDFEEKLSILCANLRVLYQPPTPDNDRLPFYRKLQDEIQSHLKVIQSLGQRYIYSKLMQLVNQFNLAYSAGNWQKSLKTISYVLDFEFFEIQAISLYFPLIVKGACELQLDLLAEAERTFTEAIKNDQADENAFGGLGQVYLRQNHLEKALVQYNLALAKCLAGEDREVLYNILVTAVEILSAQEGEVSGQLVEQALEIINYSDCITTLEAHPFDNAKDRLRTRYLIGLALFRSGRHTKAYGYFAEIFKGETFPLRLDPRPAEAIPSLVPVEWLNEFKVNGFSIPPDLKIEHYQGHDDQHSNRNAGVITDGDSLYRLEWRTGAIGVYYRELAMILYYSQLLEVLNQPAAAKNILKTEAAALNNRLLFHYYAELLIRQRCLEQAREIYRDILTQEPYNGQPLVEYSLLLKHLGKNAEMTNSCQQVIGLEMPNKRENYYQGYAYYLLGKLEAAHAFFLVSGGYAAYYPEIT